MRLAVLALLLAACQSSDKPADPAPATAPGGATAADDYSADVAKICDVERLSGADAEETTARSIIAADWLGRNLTTDRARDLLARVARQGPADKARILREEAKKAGLDGCPTAVAWEKLPSSTSAPAAP